MAIVEMKRIALLGLNQDKARLMKKMQRLGCVQVNESDQQGRASFVEHEQARLADLQRQIDRLDLTIQRLAPFDKHKPGMLDGRRAVGSEQIQSALASKGELMEAVARLEEIERTRGDLRAQEARARAQIEQLSPWANLNAPLNKIGPTKTCALTLLSVPLRRFSDFEDGLSALGTALFEEISRSTDSVNLLVAAHNDAATGLEELIKRIDAARVSFPDAQGLPSLQLDQLQGRIARIDEVRGQLSREAESLADQLPMLRLLRDTVAVERDQLAAGTRVQSTRAAFLLNGWAPAPECERIERELKRVAPLCELEFSDPGEDEKPPTMLRNMSAVSPFETIVKMFSMPDPHGLDPTLMMMPFWICFFGMMVSDAGYGILLGLGAGYLFHKLGRKSAMGKMAFILMMGGLSTVFWGAMYGGWFSIEGIPPLLFAPMDEPLMMVVLCLCIGVVHIFVGMGMAAYMNIRRGKALDAVYDQVSWMLLLIGLGLLAVNTTVGGVMAGAGVLIILLMAGRAQKNPFKRLLSGLGALYGISGFVSDILSYARLFGMGLATGVIGMVFNTLASMMMSGVGWVFAVILLVVGHTFNLMINALGAYVHSCRLQFIEFFGKFYESGGHDFVPFCANTRYVDIVGGADEDDVAA